MSAWDREIFGEIVDDAAVAEVESVNPSQSDSFYSSRSLHRRERINEERRRSSSLSRRGVVESYFAMNAPPSHSISNGVPVAVPVPTESGIFRMEEPTMEQMDSLADIRRLKEASEWIRNVQEGASLRKQQRKQGCWSWETVDRYLELGLYNTHQDPPEDVSHEELTPSEEMIRSLEKPITGLLPNCLMTEDESGTKRVYQGRSLFLFLPTNPIRLVVIRIIDSKWFERAVLLVILLNTIALALYNPIAPNDSFPNNVLDFVENIFTLLFAIEMLLKMFGLGVILHPHAYLRDGWNVMDFTIVMLGFLDMSVTILSHFISPPGADVFVLNTSAFRVFRVLRPLRTISGVAGARVMVTSLFASIPMLADVFLLCMLVFLVFGILGVQVFQGVMRQRCFDVLDSIPPDNQVVDVERLCSFLVPFPPPPYSNIMGGFYCPSGSTCYTSDSNPNYNITSFDWIGVAMLTIFQCITLEGWSFIMYDAMDATNYLAVIFFFTLIVIGAFFVINLALAVVSNKFSDSTINDIALKEARAADQLQKGIVPRASVIEKIRNFFVKASVWLEIEYDIITNAIDRMLWSLMTSTMLAPLFHVQKNERYRWRVFFLRRWGTRLVESTGFTIFIIILIILNTSVMAADFFGMPETLHLILEYLNILFTLMFTAELLLKVYSLGLKRYLEDRFNAFDAVIVFFSLIEIILDYFNVVSGLVNVSFLRTFRLLRVFKLVRSWKSLRKLLATMYASVTSVLYFSILLGLFVFIYSILGMQLFGGKFIFDGEMPRAHFDNLYNAALTVFQCLTGDAWNFVLYNGMRAIGWPAAIYFVSLFTIGNYVLFNLFVAILIQNFDTQSREQSAEEEAKLAVSDSEENMDSLFDTIPESVGVAIHVDAVESLQMTKEKDVDSGNPLRSSLPNGKTKESYALPAMEMKDIAPPSEPRQAFLEGDDVIESLPVSAGNSGLADKPVEPPRVSSTVLNSVPSETNLDSMWAGTDDSEDDVAVERVSDTVLFGTSLFIMSAKNPLRIALARAINSKYFEYYMLFWIILSSISLALENPTIEKGSVLYYSLLISDIYFTGFFTLEAMLKIFTFGLIFHKDAYLRVHWNKLDFAIVIVSWIGLLTFRWELGNTFAALRAVRILRALRPLRVISRAAGMKVAVNALIGAIPSVLNVLFVCVLFWLIFGILGMQLFSGKFFKCNDDSVQWKYQCSGFFLDPETADVTSRIWANPPYSFDNIYEAFLILFEMATLEGWADAMYSGVDSTEINQQPIRDNHPYLALYFVAFVLVGAILMVNLFVGVVIDSFNLQKMQLDGSAFLTASQKEWVDAQRQLIHMQPQHKAQAPKNRFRRCVFRIVSSRYFEYTIMIAILINMGLMCLTYYNEPTFWTIFLTCANLFFTLVFVVELMLKLVGLGPGKYWADRWNRLDVVIVVGSMLSAPISLYSLYVLITGQSISRIGNFPLELLVNAGPVVTIVRIFRVGRIFKLVKNARGLRTLFNTMVISLTSFINIGSLLFLFFFIYAVVGVSLWGTQPYGRGLDVHANFGNFPVAMMTLFRCSTGENWNDIMRDCMKQDDPCNANPWQLGCVNYFMSPAYFVSFMLFGSFVMLNLFIAVILDAFDTMLHQEEGAVTARDFTTFVEVWARYDPHATGFLSSQNLQPFMIDIGPPLGLPVGASKGYVARTIKQLDIPVNTRGQIHFKQTLLSLSKRVVGIDLPDCGLAQHLAYQITRGFPRSAGGTTAVFSVSEFYAAKWLQRAFRQYKERRNANKFALEKLLTEPVVRQAVSGATPHGIARHGNLKWCEGESWRSIAWGLPILPGCNPVQNPRMAAGMLAVAPFFDLDSETKGCLLGFRHPGTDSGAAQRSSSDNEDEDETTNMNMDVDIENAVLVTSKSSLPPDSTSPSDFVASIASNWAQKASTIAEYSEAMRLLKKVRTEQSKFT